MLVAKEQCVAEVGQQPHARRPRAGLNVLQSQVIGFPVELPAEGAGDHLDVALHLLIDVEFEKFRPRASAAARAAVRVTSPLLRVD